jgi:DNA repair protein RadC
MPNKFSLPEFKLIVNNPYTNSERMVIHSGESAVGILRDVWEADTLDLYESVYVLYLNLGMKLLGYQRVSFGGLNSSIFDPRVILASALLAGSTALIIAHNHPSGNKRPSISDQNMTKQLREAASIMNIVLVDHLIITSDSFYSFKDEGEL